MTAWRTSARTLWLSIEASASRLILSTSLRWRANLSSWYSGFRLALLRPEFFSSLCSQETCCVFLLPLSRDENIESVHTSSSLGKRGPQFARACPVLLGAQAQH